MPFARPTLSSLIADASQRIVAELPGADAALRRSVLNVFAQLLAAQHNAQYGYLDWIARQSNPFTAEGEALEAWAALVDIIRIPASYASGIATFTGTPGVAISTGTEIARADGVRFTVTAGGAIDATNAASLAVQAEDAGASGNTAAAALLQLVAPIAGIAPAATVVSIGGGADLETGDSLRTRMLLAYSAAPRGGNLGDYREWALGVPAVTRAWCSGQLAGSGIVTVYLCMDGPARPNGIPVGTNGASAFETRGPRAGGDQLLVADALYPLRAATALLYACAPIPVPLGLTIGQVPADDAIRAAIAAAVADLILREASPGGVVLPDESLGGTIALSHIEAAVAAVDDRFVITQPAGDVRLDFGQISIPGAIAYL